MFRKFAFIIAIIYSIFLVIISFINLNDFPKVEIDSGDKIVHFIAYSLMFLSWFNVYFFNKKKNRQVSILYSGIISFTFGIIIEVLQGVLTSTRTLDIYDIMFNAFGIILGILIVYIFVRKDVKNI